MEVKQALWSIENAEREKKKNFNDEIANYKLELETLKQNTKHVKKVRIEAKLVAAQLQLMSGAIDCQVMLLIKKMENN